MLSKIAWRNIWRNRTRSLVIIGSVVVGMWAGIFILALSYGMVDQRKEFIIHEFLSHVQVHTPEFKEKEKLKAFIPDGTALLGQIDQRKEVRASSGRMIINGMLNAPGGGAGIRIIGIDPEKEDSLTLLHKKVKEGEYFPEKRNRILIGKSLADKFGLKVGSKVVLTFLDTSSNIVAGAFRIAGLMSSGDARLDKVMVYARQDDLARVLSISKPFVHEIAILLKRDDLVPTFKKELQARHPDLLVEAWYDLSPEMRYVNEMMDLFMYIFIGIILLALSFGLVNTMLMAVLERTREIGMLMAIGMNKRKIFQMIVLETIMLAFTGASIGILLAWGTTALTARTGIDLSVVEQGMESFGMSPVLYPRFDPGYIPGIAFMVLVFSILSAVYPARKALKLNPSQAIRKI